MAKGPYQLRRRLSSEHHAPVGKYTHALVCMDTPRENEWGFSVITTYVSDSPIAPVGLRKRQATLNSVRMLNEMRIY